ncbi:MAG: hypothetical protein NTZ08_02920, partial [Verrucomicrobia bacterium]|nr:hypothetical protein [Verrucomicrobiota bacterium]
YGTYPNSSNLVCTNNATLSNNLANISFYSGNGSGVIGNGFEVSSFSDSFGSGSLIIAVPEPETYITAVALLLGFTFYQIRLARHGQGLLSRVTILRSVAKRKPFGGAAFALLDPCSLRPSGHLRCASSAPPGASVGLTQISNTEGL